MSFYDYIKIKGYDEDIPDDIDPETFEIFQGLGATLLDQNTADPETGLLPVAPSTPIDEALWNGQSKLIQAESVYAGQLEKLFKQQQQQMPPDDNSFLSEVIAELWEPVEDFLGDLFGGFVIGVTGAAETPLSTPVFLLSKFAFEVGISWCLGKLKALFQKGVDLCLGIIEENAAMLLLEPGMENYHLRRENLQMHTEMLENVIAQINTMEEMLDRTIVKGTDTKGIVKALKPIGELKELDGMGESLEKLQALTTAIQAMKIENEKLRAAVEDLTFLDGNLKYADNTSFHVGGKVLHH